MATPHKTVVRQIQCPYCGQFRSLRCRPSQFPDDLHPCRSCAAALGRMRGGKGITVDDSKVQYQAWDHDPWDHIRAHSVTANQLFDGWA